MPEKDEVVSEALFTVAKSIRLLGMGNIERGDLAPGAVETLGMQVRDTGEKIADAIGQLASSVSELADAVRESKTGK